MPVGRVKPKQSISWSFRSKEPMTPVIATARTGPSSALFPTSAGGRSLEMPGCLDALASVGGFVGYDERSAGGPSFWSVSSSWAKKVSESLKDSHTKSGALSRGRDTRPREIWVGVSIDEEEGRERAKILGPRHALVRMPWHESNIQGGT